MQLFIVDLEEGALDDYFSLVLPCFFFVEDHSDDSRNNAQVFLLDADRVSAAHRESLARTGLPISQNRGIKANEAAEDEISHASVEHHLLL